MKVRCDHANLYFYLQKLTKDGYTKTSKESRRGKTKIVLEKSDSPAILVTYSENGWVSVVTIK